MTKSAKLVRNCDRTEPLSRLWWNCCGVPPCFGSVPLSSYRWKGMIVLFPYGQAIIALIYIVLESEGKLDEFAWHFLRISGGLCTRGRRGSVGARDPEGKTMRVRRVQGIHTQQRGGCVSGVKRTCQRKKEVCETSRPVHGLGQTATVEKCVYRQGRR